MGVDHRSDRCAVRLWPCGYCGGDKGVRFRITGKETDGAICADCVRSAVSAHAEACRPEWERWKREREAMRRDRESVP